MGRGGGTKGATRPEAERRSIIEDYYDTYRNMVRDAPAGHGMDYVHAYMVISKQT